MPLAPAVPVDSDGTATLNVATLKFVTGLVVRYSGDANFAPTDSTSYPISFSPQPSTATVQPASSTAPVGSNVDLKVTILDDAGNPVPGASVSISPGGTTGQTGSDGITTLTVSSAVPGPVTYTVSANGITNLGSATVTYVNPAPTASATSATTNEDTVVTVPPLGSGGDGNALTYAVSSQPTNGSAAVTPQGLVYTPNANFFGTDSFTYTANDGSLTSAPATVTVTVNAVNDAPTVAAHVRDDERGHSGDGDAARLGRRQQRVDLRREHPACERLCGGHAARPRLHAECQLLRNRLVHLHRERRVA